VTEARADIRPRLFLFGQCLLNLNGGDTGSVTASNLSITGASAAGCTTAKRPVDFDGDGKTDFAVVRNTGGGPGGQITWFIHINGGADRPAQPWGSQGDAFLPADYDGDGKSDIAVWRYGAPGTAAFYILQSSNSAFVALPFGQTGDNATVVGDYDNDGKVDVAVYRAGAAAGDPSYWLYRSSSSGTTVVQQWGQNGDFPTPGDFDGDGKYDFVVQRNNGGGQARFHILSSSTNAYTSVVFGTPTDVIVAGFYDSDCKQDLVVTRGIAGQYAWFVLNSTDSSTTYYTFGNSATDFFTQGDYDGDGRTDLSVWRPDVDPANTYFYWRKSTDGTLGAFEWGQSGDGAAYFNHH
jgi:hypothetical protein